MVRVLNGGGAAGAVMLTNSGAITTLGGNWLGDLWSSSLQECTGSNGTTGGYGGAFGGNAGAVMVSQSGALTTSGNTAYGIFADSVGGVGGDGLSVQWCHS